MGPTPRLFRGLKPQIKTHADDRNYWRKGLKRRTEKVEKFCENVSVEGGQVSSKEWKIKIWNPKKKFPLLNCISFFSWAKSTQHHHNKLKGNLDRWQRRWWWWWWGPIPFPSHGKKKEKRSSRSSLKMMDKNIEKYDKERERHRHRPPSLSPSYLIFVLQAHNSTNE